MKRRLPLVAQSRRYPGVEACPLSGAKRTWLGVPAMSPFDPKRTFDPIAAGRPLRRNVDSYRQFESMHVGWTGVPDEGRRCRRSHRRIGIQAHAYQRLRTAGWVYAEVRPDALVLYRCDNPREQSQFASNDLGAKKLGKAKRLLGYALEK
jgi:hypothetical protein